jgi:hypothetical protein
MEDKIRYPKMEEQLGKILETNKYLQKKDLAWEVKNWHRGIEYTLVNVNIENREQRKASYQTGLYLVHIPKALTKLVESKDHKEEPWPLEDVFTEVRLIEEDEDVRVKYRGSVEWHLLNYGGLKTKEYRWIEILRQGDKEPLCKIQRYDGGDISGGWEKIWEATNSKRIKTAERYWKGE